MRTRAGALIEGGRNMGAVRLALAIVGAVLLACASIVPAVADVGTLVISTSPSTLSAVDLTQPHAVGVTITCPTTIGTLNATLTRPGGVSSPLQVNRVLTTTSVFFDFSVSPAPAGDYVISATSTGCGDAAPATVIVTGPDVVTDLVTTPTQLSASDFAASGVTFTGTGFHTGVTLQVASTAPGFVPTTVTTDDSGAFALVQTGSAATPDGYYSTTFTGALDGTSYGTFLVGVAPPTTSDPVLTLSTDATGGKITLSKFLATGVVASATGYAPGDLVLAFDIADASGNSYLRGNGAPDASGNFSATLNGTGDLASDRLGVHTVKFQSFLGPDVTASFEVVPDPVVTATPNPVERGATVTIGVAHLDPSSSYLVLIDGGATGFAFVSSDADGNLSAPFPISGSATIGTHTALVSPATGGTALSGTFSVVEAGSTTTTTSSTSTSTSTSTTSTTSTSTTSTTTSTTTTTTTTTTEPPTTSSTTTSSTTTTEPPTTTTTEPPPSTSTTTPPAVSPDVTLRDGPGGTDPTTATAASLAFTGARPAKTALISASLVVMGCVCIFFASRRRSTRP